MRGFVISNFLFIYCTIAGAKNIIRYSEDSAPRGSFIEVPL